MGMGFSEARLGDAVPLARVAHHLRLHTDVHQRDEKLLGLGDRHVVVVLTVKEERWRLGLGDVAQRRPLP